MKISKALHFISHFRWLFAVWMIVLIVRVYFFESDNPVPLVGTVILLSGIMMGLTSLSDITKISVKEKKELLNPKNVKRIFTVYFAALIFMVLISILFLSLKYLFPSADESLLKDFANLGYDCLVSILGFLTIIKQYADKVDYAKGLNNN